MKFKRFFTTVYEGSMMAKDVATLAWQYYILLN